MVTIYPAGPRDVPAGLTRASRAYRRNVWLAVTGLVLFILLYLALTGWFAFSAITGALRLALDGGSAGLPEWLACGGSLFLAAFLAKALFFVRKDERADRVELTRAQQPRLFAFLERIADDAGAPRPNKVFVSARVNAAVFYDLSLLNLVRPSHKHLEIGLALVNMLNLTEFKAVCAHEFGHFAQRSMALGRWVYTAQQIAVHIVAQRDLLDRLLHRLSNLDVRISWIGWLLGLAVWALRSIIDIAFRLVVLAQRALSREMEMQADLVAVSLTGSDAIVHALHRLQIADDAWDRTLGLLRSEVANGRPPRDAFVVHQAFADRLGRIYNDPAYGQRPQVPADAAGAFRVFDREIAQPPRMWATHPQNHEREENAKRTYLAATADERSAWLLFDDAPSLREHLTATLIGDTGYTPVDPDVSLRQLDEHFVQEHLGPQYRGIYMGLPATRHARSAQSLTEPVAHGGSLDIDTLYPAAIGHDLERLRKLDREHALLCSLRDGRYQAIDGVIRHRGRILRRAELPGAIDAVDAERSAARGRLQAVLKAVRSAHLAAADTLSPAWRAYLEGLLRLLHYAEHTEANVRDAHAHLSLWRQRATAGGTITEHGIGHIVRAAEQLQRALAQVFQHAEDVRPGAPVLAALDIDNWPGALAQFALAEPVRNNIDGWLRAVGGWVQHVTGHLSALRRATLDELLRAEAIVAAHASSGAPATDAPPAPTVPAAYDTLVVGTERVLHVDKPTFRERFSTASGVLPGMARAAVALGIVGSVLVFGWMQGRVTVSVYNGLARPVSATIDGRRVQLQPGASADVIVHGGRDIRIVSTTADGEPIESFDAPVGFRHARFVYTVAAAAPLRLWTAAYGSASAPPPHWLAPLRWQPASADYVFTRPPASIRTKDGGATRTVLDAAHVVAPETLVRAVGDNAAAAMVLSHVRYDPPDSPYLRNWLDLARTTPGFDRALAARRAHFPADASAPGIGKTATASRVDNSVGNEGLACGDACRNADSR
ncbi:TPA: M48 family metallopeptidase [Burkholderia cenocepacia]|uniref:M48 family metallopeptidase n=1 Tax=unclassified Burkholderia TaxID=2613784 RepID=UPI00158C7BF0|nr:MULTISPECIES: M48 family metallopeptidase [unclassified Burkholderia]HEF5869661.1 M48 family metallopeptidase [Burkholderia cenocepacia]